jgi:hypothetical protein
MKIARARVALPVLVVNAERDTNESAAERDARRSTSKADRIGDRIGDRCEACCEVVDASCTPTLK